tara:strand:- start:275 stop:703 length:429 start_codon:yes stop_codon:yes gene_type:complete
MALTFDDALTALIARLNAAGLNQARSPLGVRNESAPRIDRSFAVLLNGIDPPDMRGRDRYRAGYRFTVELCHVLKPTAGLEATDQACKDWQSAIKYIAAKGTTLTQSGSIDIGSTAYSYPGGGAFVVASFPVTVSCDLPLAI